MGVKDVRKVKAEKEVFFFTKIDEGLLHLIEIYGVTKLVMGAASDRHYKSFTLSVLIDCDKNMTIFVAQKNESTTITNSNKCDAKSTFILQYMVYLQREANMCQAKRLGCMYINEMELRKETEAKLSQEKEESESLKHATMVLQNDLDWLKYQLNEKANRLQDLNQQKHLLEHRISESDSVATYLEESMKVTESRVQSLKLEYSKMKRERDDAVKEARSMRIEKELTNSCAYGAISSEFSLMELEQATQNFSNALNIGQGGFGSVYKGSLRNTTVAIKMLSTDSLHGQSQFHQEVAILSRVRHPNLVTLIGACTEASALVYELLPNGSLEDRLNCVDNTPPLTWQVRIQIITEICSALIFLHKHRPHPVVHGDLKPGNILLDANLQSKLSDFGISRLLLESSVTGSDAHYTSRPMGTPAYMDPEFFATGELTPQSDTYSFGVTIMRLLTGRAPLRLIRTVREALNDDDLQSVLDHSAGDWPLVHVEQLAHIALQCTELSKQRRPDLEHDVWEVIEPMKKEAHSPLSQSFRSICSAIETATPSYFLCPISQVLQVRKVTMRDPQMAADGFTYEADAIRDWLDKGHDRSPAAEANLRKQLEQTLAGEPSSPLHHYNLGVFLWDRAEAAAREEGEEEEEVRRLRAAAAERFLAAAKLDPNDGVPFRFLGHHYALAGDAQRAAKCYQRAATLNPDDAEAGEAVCDLLDLEGKESLEIALCKEAAGKSPRAFWAFRRLGYLQALGLAYHRLGMFTAAVKSYGRAVELDGSKVFALIESGNIQLMLGYFRKGVEQFRSALEMAPQNHSAYFGLASALLAWARQCVMTGAFGWAASLLKLALARCFPWDDGNIKGGMDDGTFRTTVLEWRNTCLLAANGAKFSYQRALHLTPWEANIHNDTAICLDLIYTIEENNSLDPITWELPEKMSLGGLILEPVNKDFWVTLGSVSSNQALKQHSFIRALHLDMSLSEAWAYLGKLPEFQIGLGTIAARSGELLSPQVLMAVRQAVQRAPHYPESHNINGLVSEVRSDFQSAIASYRQAKFALDMMRNSKTDCRCHIADISVNLARSLCKIYALSLWKLGRHDEALSVSRNLAENLSSMKQESATAALGFICTLTYNISGKDSAAAVIHKLPGQLNYSTQLKFIISALDALQPNKRFQLPQLSMPPRLTSYEVMSEVHSNIALGNAIGGESDKFLRVYGGLSYLKKVLHMYPDCSLVRNQLGSLLLSSEDWMASHKAVRVTSLSRGYTSNRGLRSPHQIQACAAVSCYATCTSYPKFSFPTCEDQYLSGYNAICRLQRWVHLEPWNQDARRLLVLTLFQKAREEKYPKHICTILKRLILQVLSSGSNSQDNKVVQYGNYLLLLVASEVSLQSGDHGNCIAQATEALGVTSSSVDSFFAHLQLCRAYVMQGNLLNSRSEYMKCLQNRTDTEIGWVILKQLASICSLEGTPDEIEIHLRGCVERKGSNASKWMSLFYLACAQCSVWNEDFASAEKAIAQACAEGDPDSCVLFLNGAICMDIAWRFAAPQFIARAASSLRKAQQKSLASLPIVSLLLAQAEGSLGSKAKWEKNLRLEWFSWPPELRPAELYFQMHLLATQSSAATSQQNQLVETMQTPEKWLLRAIHLNPSCSRYWTALMQLVYV
uniref:Protein kinase domain-containing protein n=1 Tax=Oryza nivara TaxID=4536 RepID=A0A0E0IW20_ORYNI